ncbi:hypothetical protein [uncultured Anaerovibrio sp.]|uniref:hypothetical protein n=1 Tax=uncultured Anaerovibrio sp. TaxID=361586 RepID=UPI00260222D0|nr:hypothetical protein [uncultured Anaerovibrio sp.]
MTTEILGFLIIVGAIIVLLARRQLQKVEEDPEVMEASAGRLRYELEQSADEIINRMAGHVDHLEALLREADYKAELLQQRIDELKRLQALQGSPMQAPTGQRVGPRDMGALQAQMAAAGSSSPAEISEEVLYKANEARLDSSMEDRAFSQLLDSNLKNPDLMVPDNVEYADISASAKGISAAGDTPAEANTGEYSGEQPAYDEPEPDSDIPQEAQLALEAFREVSKNLEAAQNDMGLHVDISSEPEDSYMTGMDHIAEAPAPPRDKQENVNIIEDPDISDSDDATEIARKLLIAGYTPEEVGKFTGLGMNAIALLRQIHKV